MLMQAIYNLWQQEEYKPYPVQPNPPASPFPNGSTVKSAPPTEPSIDEYRNFDIVKATQYGIYERCVELVEDGYDVNQPDHENVTVLHWAAINNRQDIVR